MGKIKRLAFVAMLTAVVSIVAACGRNDSNGNTSGSTERTTAQMTEATKAENGPTDSSEPYVNDVTTGEYGSTGSHENGNNGNNNEETGGVLRDMVDDVEQGIDHVTDSFGNGTTSQSGSMNGQ